MVNQGKIRNKIQTIKDNLAKLNLIKSKEIDEFLKDPFLTDAVAFHFRPLIIAHTWIV